MLKKKNTFKDYISSANYLIKNKYTSAGKVIGMGGSAGGLLMGAVVNQKPELFLGIVMAVPFVDSLTTNLDHSLPLTIGEFKEFGNVLETAITSAELFFVCISLCIAINLLTTSCINFQKYTIS